MLNDVQLRSFSVDKHCARYYVALHSPEALASWEYESDDPELDRPPCMPLAGYCSFLPAICTDTYRKGGFRPRRAERNFGRR